MTCQKGAGGCGYEFCWICKAKWPGYSHVCDGFTESSDLKPKSWNEGEAIPKGLLTAKPGLEVGTHPSINQSHPLHGLHFVFALYFIQQCLARTQHARRPLYETGREYR